MVDQNVMPNSFSRGCGGWLAVSPPEAMFKIGTTGATKDEANARFFSAWQAWMEASMTDAMRSGSTVKSDVGVFAT